MEKTAPVNVCDQETGVCIRPNVSAHHDLGIGDNLSTKSVQLLFFTDPMSAACWCLEPQMRLLQLNYRHVFDIAYFMGGLMPSWNDFRRAGVQDPAELVEQWRQFAQRFGMPIDGSVWLQNPLPSSFPPSVAFVSARRQGIDKAIRFLRNLREQLFLQNRNICDAQTWLSAAQIAQLDVDRFVQDCRLSGRQDLQKDLAFTEKWGVQGFPTIVMMNLEGQRGVVYGVRSFDHLERQLTLLSPQAQRAHYDATPEALFMQFSTMTTLEFATLSHMHPQTAEKRLLDLVQQGMIRHVTYPCGDLWTRF